MLKDNSTSQDQVKGIFSSVAKNYDLMNDLMSFGLHRQWKRRFNAMVQPCPEMRVLDIAAGSGDIALNLYKTHKPSIKQLVLLDPNPEMLAQAKRKFINNGVLHGVHYEEGYAEKLPYADETFTHITISFGLRNVEHRQQALQEMYRVLSPGGQLLIMEFHKPQSLFGKAFKLYGRVGLPLLGRVVAQDADAYSYLYNSIKDFPPQDDIQNSLHGIGFKVCETETLCQGLVSIYNLSKNEDTK